MAKDKWVSATAVILVASASIGIPAVFGFMPDPGSWKYLVGLVVGALGTAALCKDHPQAEPQQTEQPDKERK